MYTYTLRIRLSSFDTAQWLDARGYLGDIFEQASGHNESDETDPDTGEQLYEFRFTEAGADAVLEAVEEDPHAFLTCNGDGDLRDRLFEFLEFLDSVV